MNLGGINYEKKYAYNRPKHDTPLASKRRENANAKTRAIREAMEKHQKAGTLTKEIISQLYKR